MRIRMVTVQDIESIEALVIVGQYELAFSALMELIPPETPIAGEWRVLKRLRVVCDNIEPYIPFSDICILDSIRESIAEFAVAAMLDVVDDIERYPSALSKIRNAVSVGRL